MSLPVVVHFNQRFCLFFNTDRPHGSGLPRLQARLLRNSAALATGLLQQKARTRHQRN